MSEVEVVEKKHVYVVLHHEMECPYCDACTSAECPYKEMVEIEKELRHNTELGWRVYA